MMAFQFQERWQVICNIAKSSSKWIFFHETKLEAGWANLDPRNTLAFTILLKFMLQNFQFNIFQGSESAAFKEGRAFGVQSLSGTGALLNGGDFLAKQLGRKICYVSDPTWGNHNMVFKYCGFAEVRKYR